MAVLFGDADWTVQLPSTKPLPQFLLEEEIPLLHLYHQAMKSGAQLVRCPTGKTSFSWLEPLGLAEKIEAVHNVAVQSAKHTQAQGNFDLLVAGVIGPRPQTAPYANERALEREVSEPAIYLIDKGVDCLLTQGFEDLNTLEIALRAIKDVNRVPVPVSVFFRPGPELLHHKGHKEHKASPAPAGQG